MGDVIEIPIATSAQASTTQQASVQASTQQASIQASTQEASTQEASTVTATQPPYTAPTTPTKSSGSMWVLWFVLGLVFFFALIYLLSSLFKKGGAGGKLNFGANKEGGDSSASQKPKVQTVYVNSGGANTASSTNANAVATKGSFSAELKKAQQNMIDTCGVKMPLYGADGYLGDELLAAIKVIAERAGTGAEGKKHYEAIRTTGYITRPQMDWLLAPCSEKSTNVETAKVRNLNKVTAEEVEKMTDSEVYSYLESMLGATPDQVSGTWGSWKGRHKALKNWAMAIANKKETFVCPSGDCIYPGTYSTQKGMKL